MTTGLEMPRPPSRRTGMNLRPVSRVSFTLTDTDAFEKAINQSVTWLGTKAGIALPSPALDRLSFDLRGVEGANECHAIRFDGDEGATWAARVDEPGFRPDLGEMWSTELFVERRAGDLVRFGAQLSARRAPGMGVKLTRQRVVRDILSILSAEADGVAITEAPTVYSAANVYELANLAYRGDRRLPIVAIATDASGGPQINPQRIATRLSGAAHIAYLEADASWELTRLLTKRMSVFNGAIRIYMPGLTDDNEDQFAHPLWLPQLAGGTPRHGEWLLDSLAESVFPLGFRDREGDSRFWHIAQIRQVATTAAANAAVGGEVEKLRAELEAAKAVAASSRDDAESAEELMQQELVKRTAAETEAARIRADLDNLKTENFKLIARLAGLGEVASQEPNDRLLLSYEDLEDWATETLGPHIFVHSRAIKDCRVNGHADMLERIEKTLLAIRDYWIPSKIHGGMDRKNAAVMALAKLGVEDEPCFARRDRAKKEPQYSVTEGSVTWVLYEHFKYGNSRNNAEQYRIYYAWDEEAMRLIIGKMPTHLTTAAS